MARSPRIPHDLFVEGLYGAFGGDSSAIQQPTRAVLGNPALGVGSEPTISEDERDYPGQVWVHTPAGSYPEPDTETSDRDDSPAGIFTAFLPRGVLSPGDVRYGTEVRLKVVDGILEIIGEGGIPARQFNDGVPEFRIHGIERHQFDWGLIRPTDPPSGRVVLSGSVVTIDGTAYNVPALVTANLIDTYAGTLEPGQALAVLITVDPTGPTVVYDAGDAFTDTSRDAASGVSDHSAVFADYPTTIPNDEGIWGWVKLYYGIQQIVSEDILPALFTGKGQLGGSVTELADLTDVDEAVTPTNNFVLVGDGSVFESRLLNLPDLGDVDDSTAPTVNTYLKGTGSLWAPGTINLNDLPTIIATSGGTGQTSYTTGDILYASMTNVLAKRGIGGEGQVLKVVSGVPNWANESGGGGGGGSITSGASMTDAENPLTNNDTIADGSSVAVEFTTVSFDTDGYTDLGSDPAIFTIPGNGLYQVVANVTVSASGGTPDGPVIITISGTGGGAGTMIYLDSSNLGVNRYASAVGTRNINSGGTVNLTITNECGETITFAATLTIVLFGDQLATP